ncbi:dihydropteroate synthase [Nocardioides sp. GY 10127]|uniref:dihydropteroate synthase n=1 Tax=Nocardioides sp. GY 10127 TaxID=2569762 RepID=UPI0010A82337|nr:dihydropteroate synthase [Nocardioides sp. GY 10127]TIC79503.1 dihydropteroate synthase [Nocardioides sp. GY 10127]
MGVVNVTPDSFSDGGRYLDTGAAVEHGLALLADGADVLDIGGESTRPGATRPLVADELGRVVPVIERLAAQGATVSVDTMRAEVARAAVDAGAAIVNDVSGGLADPGMAAAVAATDALFVAMHWRSHSTRMYDLAVYDGPGGVVGAVVDELADRLEALAAAGLAPERVVLDPGLGFAKRGEQNWELLRGLDALDALGRPVLVGASRKSFLGALLAGPDGEPRGVEGREHAHQAVIADCARRGTWGVRVHDVRATRDTLAAVAALAGPSSAPSSSSPSSSASSQPLATDAAAGCGTVSS